MYFARVRSTTSSGRAGGGLFLSQEAFSSQSRTNCLSIRWLAAARRVLVGRPEAGAIGRKHFVDQDQSPINRSPFELRVGD